jgi:hypothetical protein
MAHNLDARLQKLEAAETRRTYEIVAAEYGVDPDELMRDAEAFFALSLAEQLAEVDRIDAELRAEGLVMEDFAEIKADLIRAYRP